MWSFFFFTAAGSLGVFLCVSAGPSGGTVDVDTMGFVKRSLQPAVLQELASLLSDNATIITPSDDSWVYETERYMQAVQPSVQLSVQVGNEDDVSVVVSAGLQVHPACPSCTCADAQAES